MTYPEARFEWDAGKNLANQRKHGVSFEEASELLVPGAVCFERFDHAHSGTEERFVSIGPSQRRLLVVVWTERDDGVIRVISARPVTKRERALYFVYLEQDR